VNANLKGIGGSHARYLCREWMHQVQAGLGGRKEDGVERRRAQRVWQVALLVLGLLACGGGDDEGAKAPARPGNEGQGWVTISTPGSSWSGTTEAPTFDLGGLAFNTPLPAYPCDFGTTDTCQNLTTGAMGWVVPSTYAPTGGCAYWAHRFTAQVNLVPGPNLILIKAMDAHGNVGRAYLTPIRTLDTTPPTLLSTYPAAEGTGIPLTAQVVVSFSDWMDASSLNGGTFQVRDALNQPLSGTLTYEDRRIPSGTETLVNHLLAFTPTASLQPASTYTVTLGTGIRNLDGQALPLPLTWSFGTTP
jgi:hypothetical protein